MNAVPPAYSTGSWVATLAPGPQPFHFDADEHGARTVATSSGCTVVFDGLLHTRPEWLGRFTEASEAEPADAELVLRAYLAWGEEVLDRIKGLFALVVWDSKSESLLCARDPHGLHPLFYAESDGQLFLSASIEAIVAHPSVPADVDRVALADHLCHRWPTLDSTYFAAVSRLPGGYALRAGRNGRTVWRYWDPIPPGKPIDYLADEEVGHFDELLDDAVERCLRAGSAAIYLSGGLDSITVAAVAKEAIERRGMDPLLALSLVFEHPLANEQAIQREVAARLDVPQEIVTIREAVGEGGLLASALEMSARRPAPMINLWNPAYRYLAEHARARGYGVILTGNGGDEWLEAGVHKASQALREGDVAAVFRLWSTMQRSYRFTRGTVARNVFWTYGLRPIVRDAAAGVLERTSPQRLERLRRDRMEAARPAWVAADPALREAMFARYEQQVRTRSRGALDSPIVAYELEEFFESGREVGMRLLHPFWDADLTAFLARAPMRMLIRGGRSKGLVRQSLAQRFPDLGFERHRKVNASDFYRSVLTDEGRVAWSAMGGAEALAGLGVVDGAVLNRSMSRLFAGRGPAQRVPDLVRAQSRELAPRPPLGTRICRRTELGCSVMPQTRTERVVAAVMLISSVILIALIVRETARTDAPRAAAGAAEVGDAVSPSTTSARAVEPATTEVTTTVPAATVAAAAKPPAPRLARVVLVASGGDSWLEVRAGSAQGEVLYEGILARSSDVRAAAKQLWSASAARRMSRRS